MNNTSLPLSPKQATLLTKLESILNALKLQIAILEQKVNRSNVRIAHLNNELTRTKHEVLRLTQERRR